LVAGLQGSDLLEPVALADGFARAMLVTAGMAVAGGILAFTTIRADVLRTAPVGEEASSPERAATDFACAVAGTPLRPAREARCVPRSEASLPVSPPK
jgi:hypothetical protein